MDAGKRRDSSSSSPKEAMQDWWVQKQIKSAPEALS